MNKLWLRFKQWVKRRADVAFNCSIVRRNIAHDLLHNFTFDTPCILKGSVNVQEYCVDEVIRKLEKAYKKSGWDAKLSVRNERHMTFLVYEIQEAPASGTSVTPPKGD